MAIGDWGQLFPQQEEVAWAMAEWAEDNDPEFIVALGDNFYPNGVHGVNDPQWDLKWYNIYYNDSIKDLPWYITVGNHDYGDSYGTYLCI
jgi:metallophosphoesterase superfamily enzyme